MESGEGPAKTAATRPVCEARKISPPFSTMTSGLSARSARPTAPATAPATAAMGPTPAAAPAASISLTMGGAPGSAGQGSRASRKPLAEMVHHDRFGAVPGPASQQPAPVFESAQPAPQDR